MSFGLARKYSIGGYVERVANSPKDTSVGIRGKYRVSKEGDIVELRHYGTPILAYDTRYGTPVREESYGGYSVSDQGAMRQALGVLGNYQHRRAVATRAGGKGLRLEYPKEY